MSTAVATLIRYDNGSGTKKTECGPTGRRFITTLRRDEPSLQITTQRDTKIFDVRQ